MIHTRTALPRALAPLAAAIALTLALLSAAPGCASAAAARFDAAAQRETPPPDFQLGLTVQAPLSRLGARAVITPARDGQPATQTFVTNTPYGQRGVANIPLSHRPARFVIEADWILRAAVGYGASETVFPPNTRQLNASDISALWSALRDAGLLDPDHPAIVSAPPEPEQAFGRTHYVLSYQVAGVRRTLVFDAGLPPTASPPSPTTTAASTVDPDAQAVRGVLEQLAALAWQS
ncbi:MAG: hypothetical protein KF768_07110 [Phycisphaeraceae bacterium]|nr:hypothetical protein [Phycisphaeraceae bacterium]